MMKKEVLCKTCVRWVDCGKKDGEQYGFCVLEPLYTYTAYTRCSDYLKGTPLKEKEL